MKNTDWYIELHPSQIAIDVHDHILHHLPQRLDLGSAVIVCEQPERFQPALAKRWKKVMSIVERLHASTLDRRVKGAIHKQLELLRRTRFVLQPNRKPEEPQVFVQSPDEAALPKQCATLYITTAVTPQQLDKYARQMPAHHAILVYNGGRNTLTPQRLL